MDTVLFLILVIVLGAALPWGPHTAYGRSQYHRLTDKQPPADETKVFDHEALQKAAVKLKHRTYDLHRKHRKKRRSSYAMTTRTLQR